MIKKALAAVAIVAAVVIEAKLDIGNRGILPRIWIMRRHLIAKVVSVL